MVFPKRQGTSYTFNNRVFHSGLAHEVANPWPRREGEEIGSDSFWVLEEEMKSDPPLTAISGDFEEEDGIFSVMSISFMYDSHFYTSTAGIQWYKNLALLMAFDE